MSVVRDRPDSPAEVLPTSEARKVLPKTSREFALKGKKAKPVFFGAHRVAAGVMLPYEAYLAMLDRIDDLSAALQVQARDAHDDGTRLSVDELLDELGFDRETLEAEIAAEDEA